MHLLRGIRLAAYLLVAGLLLLPVFAPRTAPWWLENLANLQLQWSLAALALLLLGFDLPRRLIALVATVYALLVGYHFLPLYWPQPTPSQPGAVISVAQLNLRYWNPNIDDIVSDLVNSQYDVVVIQEISDRGRDTMARLTEVYPYSIGSGSLERFSSRHALFSRWPLTGRRIHDLGYSEGRVIDVDVAFEPAGQTLRMVSLHPGAPRRADLWRLRNSTLAFVGNLVATSNNENQIVIGDLNVSPWSPHLTGLLDAAGLQNTAAGYGYIPSWSVFQGRQMLGYLASVYVDHCLTGPGLQPLQKRYRMIAGSDHVLIETRLALRRQPDAVLAP